VKLLGHEANHSLPSSAKVKNAQSCTSTPPIRLHGVVLNEARDNVIMVWCLVKHRDTFTLVEHRRLHWAGHIPGIGVEKKCIQTFGGVTCRTKKEMGG
jgi:hypothetical protein